MLNSNTVLLLYRLRVIVSHPFFFGREELNCGGTADCSNGAIDTLILLPW
jgi:hypothetical protein